MKNPRPSLASLAGGIIALPFTVLIVIPTFLLLSFGHGLTEYPEYRQIMFFAGFVPALAGLYLAAETTRAFFTRGKGTPAPWDPPSRLVRTGLYGRMRNPMITGAILILIGESFILNSMPILAWAAVFFIANHFYFILTIH